MLEKGPYWYCVQCTKWWTSNPDGRVVLDLPSLDVSSVADTGLLDLLVAPMIATIHTG